jgi:uncharacterized protein (TIGR03118 family)
MGVTRAYSTGGSKMMTHLRASLLALVVGLVVLMLTVNTAAADSFIQTNLVSDITMLATITDSSLKNPWGVSESPMSPFWVSDQATGVATLYAVTAGGVTKNSLTVTIPSTPPGPPVGPTGQVFNNQAPAFSVGGSPATFIFANLNGTISAWNNGAGTMAVVEATTSGAVYTGLAIGSNASGPLLYAANGAGNRIDVFNGSFAPVNLGANAFANPFAGLVPFNVQNIGGQIYVTYALPGRAAQIAATEGQGAVAIFDTSGNLVKTLISGSKLASPWGMTLAPPGFGSFGGDLLVGNFSFVASEINAFDPTTGTLLGTIPINAGAGNAPGGLWALIVGNGANGGDPHTVYFSDGINGEADGLFASLSPVPEPGTLVLSGSGLAGIAGVAWRTHRNKRRTNAHLS